MAKIPLTSLNDFINNKLGLGKAKTPADIDKIVKVLRTIDTKKKFMEQFKEMEAEQQKVKQK